MARNILFLILAVFLISGCATDLFVQKEQILKTGTFQDKLDFIQKYSSDKKEVVEFFGCSDIQKDFFDGSSLWTYQNTEQPFKVFFGPNGRVNNLEIIGQANPKEVKNGMGNAK